MEKKNVLVTGGTGFLGSYILRYLLKSGYKDIYAIKRKSSSLDLVKEIETRIKWMDCDIMDQSCMEEVLTKVDYVINSAAVISFVKKDISRMMEINVKGTEQLLNLSLALGVKKFVQISSIAALGREKNNQTLNEKTKWVKSKFATNYAISKYLSELECFRAEAEGLNMAILNPSLILGAGLWKSGSTNIFKKVYEGLSFYTEGGTGIVDVRDVAILAVKLLESDISGERIIANGDNISFKDLLTEISKKFHKKPPTRPLNPLLREIVWRIEYVKSLIKNESPIITRESIRQSSATFYFENTKSRNLLGHTYIPWKDSISDSVKAFSFFVEERKIQTLDFVDKE